MKELKGLKIYSLIFGILYSIQAALAIFVAFATKNVINSAVYGGNFKFWAITFGVVCITLPLFNWTIKYSNQRLTDKNVKNLRLEFLNKIQTSNFEKIRNYHAGVLISRAGADIRSIVEKKTKTEPSIIGQIVQLIGAVTVLFVMNAGIAIITLIAGAALVSLGYLFRKILRKKQREIKKAGENVVGAISETVNNPEIIRTTIDSNELSSRLEKKLNDWLLVKKSLTLFSTIGSSLFSWAIQIATCILIIWGAFEIGKGNMLYGDLFAIIQIIGLFRSPISSLTNIQAQLASYDASKERVLEIMELEDGCHFADCHSERNEESSSSQIQLSSISFKYADEPEYVFKDYSVVIRDDEWTALTGLSGYGKTTLFRILLGLVKPENGEIFLPKNITFAYLPQEPVLFSGTIRDNMLIAKPDATDEEINSALEKCQCNFLGNDGLDLALSQNGDGLSVGQKQRLCAARTILQASDKNAFLLLDEPTSSIDREMAESLLKSLKKAFNGALVATHKDVNREIYNNEIRIDE